MIEFSNSEYLKAYGKNPRGEGQWAFSLGRYGRTIFWFGSLTKAKAAVRRKAKEEGFNGTIYVLP